MENKNELRDILIDSSASEKTQNTKRLIIIATLLILIFIVVLVIMRLINKPDDTSSPFTPIVVNSTLLDPKIENITEKTDDPIIIVETDIIEVDMPKISTIVDPIKTEIDKKEKKPDVSVKEKNIKKGLTYIQVGSIAKAQPDKKFLNSLTSKGYLYLQHETVVKGVLVTKILIGPYESDMQARSALPKLKEDVVKDAFIYKIN